MDKWLRVERSGVKLSTMVSTFVHSIRPPNFNLSSIKISGRNKTISSPFIRASNSNLPDSSSLFNAAKHTVDSYIESGMVIGLGSGHASGMAIHYLGQKLRRGALKDIVGIPTSEVSATEAAKAGIPLDQYQDISQIDFAFDDADVIEEETLIAVIGRRKPKVEESIIQEKSILNAANKRVFMILEKQYKGVLDGSIPVLVQSLNWMQTAEKIDDLFLGDAEVWRRPAIGDAGPLGGNFPLVTREGHNVLDVIFTSPIQNLVEVADTLDKLDGVVDHGIVSKFPCIAVIVSDDDGLCIVKNPPTDAVKVVL